MIHINLTNNESLTISEEHIRMQFEKMQSGFIIIKILYDDKGLPCDSVILEMNRSFEELMGADRSFIGKKISTLYAGIDSYFLQKFTESSLSNKREGFVHYFESFQRWCAFTGYRLEKDKFACIVNDITERKIIEEEMKLKDMAIESSINSIVISELDGNLIYVNTSAVEMWGYESKEEFLQKKITSFWETETEFNRVIDELLKRGSFIGEMKARKKDGTIFDVQVIRGLLWDEKKKKQYMVASFVDISETKQLEREILNIIEDERRRIGQDLHDELGQLLTGISFLTKTLENKIIKNFDVKIDEVDEIKKLIKRATGYTRHLSRTLFPVNLEQGGFLLAFDELFADIERTFNVKCHFTKEGNILLKDNTIVAQLFHIAQEAVSNAIKHGEADNIFIFLKSDQLGLVLTIRDDGHGVIVEKEKETGMGLRIMEFRTSLVGGEFDAGNHVDGGFIVSIKLKDID